MCVRFVEGRTCDRKGHKKSAKPTGGQHLSGKKVGRSQETALLVLGLRFYHQKTQTARPGILPKRAVLF